MSYYEILIREVKFHLFLRGIDGGGKNKAIMTGFCEQLIGLGSQDIKFNITASKSDS